MDEFLEIQIPLVVRRHERADELLGLEFLTERRVADQGLGVYAELCGIIRDEVNHRQQRGEPLPKAAVRVTRDVDLMAA